MSVRNWLKKRAYFNNTVGIIQAMTLMLGDEGKLLAKHSGVREGILLNFTERRPEAVAATYISAALVADSIDEIEAPPGGHSKSRRASHAATMAVSDGAGYGRGRGD